MVHLRINFAAAVKPDIAAVPVNGAERCGADE
jgi:hypothetical protein